MSSKRFSERAVVKERRLRWVFLKREDEHQYKLSESDH